MNKRQPSTAPSSAEPRDLVGDRSLPQESRERAYEVHRARSSIDCARAHSLDPDILGLIGSWALLDATALAFAPRALVRDVDSVVGKGTWPRPDELGALFSLSRPRDAEAAAGQNATTQRWQRGASRILACSRALRQLALRIASATTPTEERDAICDDIDAIYETANHRQSHNVVRFDTIECIRFVAAFKLPILLDALCLQGALRSEAVATFCPNWRSPVLLARDLIGLNYPDFAAALPTAGLEQALQSWGHETVWPVLAAMFKEARLGTSPATGVKRQYLHERSRFAEVERSRAFRMTMWQQIADLLEALGCGHVEPEAFEGEWVRTQHP